MVETGLYVICSVPSCMRVSCRLRSCLGLPLSFSSILDGLMWKSHRHDLNFIDSISSLFLIFDINEVIKGWVCNGRCLSNSGTVFRNILSWPLNLFPFPHIYTDIAKSILNKYFPWFGVLRTGVVRAMPNFALFFLPEIAPFFCPKSHLFCLKLALG